MSTQYYSDDVDFREWMKEIDRKEITFELMRYYTNNFRPFEYYVYVERHEGWRHHGDILVLCDEKIETSHELKLPIIISCCPFTIFKPFEKKTKLVFVLLPCNVRNKLMNIPKFLFGSNIYYTGSIKDNTKVSIFPKDGGIKYYDYKQERWYFDEFNYKTNTFFPISLILNKAIQI